ncbi:MULTISPECIES: primase alpha helix C-terminal domain-containing protein [Staphylococcus]|uniref:Primase alpha helix C-terminal domain-containing protein n=1 Tax=Staphylococcus pasteuri_A TaxID=3062664 RepID=A0AAW7YPC2_9STAP|nr:MULTISPECIES: primase alpha helix C-terminal domain-containing protein [Staphylococcus]MBO0378003.1 primase alpha helix C-terminal domain-containing protein [Staphylococcus warneri]MCT2595730.1 primase alpha helix C-terminal domain-containing protein [Staphylococcus warneri]MDO6572949.1 primase alpha helix C-terminal domain-containing protein [Staphylococcus pasteuri_A]VED27113.1 putative phage primase [Staphylococcus warneri]
MNKIKLEHDTQVSVVWYNNLDSRSFKNFSQPKWSELINRLSIPQNNTDKYARGVAVYGDMNDGTDENGNEYQKYRNNDNVIYRDVLVLDYDDIPNLRPLHDAITDTLKGVAWFWHTTFNHQTESPRIRLYVPLNERVNADDYRKYTKVLVSKIGHRVDEGSFQPSRAMALPVKKSNDSFYIFKYNDAPAIKKEELNKMVVKNAPITVDYSNHFHKRNSSYWREIAFGVGEGERNQTLASLTGYLLRRYVDANLVYGLVSAWAMTCRPPIEQKEVNRTFKSILKKDSKNK